METAWQTIGRFRGLVNPAIDSPQLRDSLAGITEAINAPEARILQAGRHRTIRFVLDSRHGKIDAVAKVFGRQSIFKDFWDKAFGTKAMRTYAASEFLTSAAIGTTTPIACLERWNGPKLAESYFVSFFVEDMACCKDMLVDLWKRNAPYADFVELMRITAKGVRRLHDAGCLHGDLGNQNIFFTRRAKGMPYRDALFLDLNRARFGHTPSDDERARDLCRIALPLAFFPEFFRLYWDGEAPRGFEEAWRRCRAGFRFHSATRKFRHPLREISYKLDPRRAPAQASYPTADKQWVWDAMLFRPAPVLPPKDQLKLLDHGYRAKLLRDGKRMECALDIAGERRQAAEPPAPDAEPPIFRPIVNALESTIDAELAAIREAGATKALVRFSMSDPADVTESKLRGAKSLAEAGIGVAVLAVQMPRYVKTGFPEFAGKIADALRGKIDWIAAGQGINTLSWGIRSAADAKDVISAGENLVFNRPANSIKVASSAIEAPVLQPGCANITDLFGRNARYSAITLAWNRAAGPAAEEARALHALAARTFYARRKIIIISDTPRESGLLRDHELSGFVSEICAPFGASETPGLAASREFRV